ncbi:hypothetical protein F4775DRAFT_607586 [Biscogniauxia sp. FL1348]|nr:hypothetical protein F4775DRAFT_607586 [Biscogniauxia sp. FL1348]
MNGLSEERSMELIRKMAKEMSRVADVNAKVASDLASLTEANVELCKHNTAHADSNARMAQQNLAVAQELVNVAGTSRDPALTKTAEQTTSLATKVDLEAQAIRENIQTFDWAKYHNDAARDKHSALSGQSMPLRRRRAIGRVMSSWNENADNDLMLHASLCGNVDVDIIRDYEAVFNAMRQKGWKFTIDDIKARWKGHVFPKIAAARLSAEAARARAKKDDESDDEYYHYQREIAANPIGRDDFPLDPLPKNKVDEQDDGYRLPATTYDPYRDDEAYRRPFKSNAEVKDSSVKDAPAVASKSEVVNPPVAEKVPDNKAKAKPFSAKGNRKLYTRGAPTGLLPVLKPYPIDSNSKDGPGFYLSVVKKPREKKAAKAAGPTSSQLTPKRDEEQIQPLEQAGSSLTPLGDSKFSYGPKARSEGDVPSSRDTNCSNESVCGSCARHDAKDYDGGDAFLIPANYDAAAAAAQEGKTKDKGKGKERATTGDQIPEGQKNTTPTQGRDQVPEHDPNFPNVGYELRKKLREIQARAEKRHGSKTFAERRRFNWDDVPLDPWELDAVNYVAAANKLKEGQASKKEEDHEHGSHLSDESSFGTCAEGEEQH